MARTIPTIPLPGMVQWRQVLKENIITPSSVKIPWNFQVATKQGGNYLTWQVVEGADGYIVDIASTGDFSTPISSIILKGNQSTAYFDSVPTSGGTAPATRFYRVHATAGTIDKPQSVTGPPTGVISANAIAPNDTVTASSTTLDITTVDGTQALSRNGYYFDFE